jgi:hypothetical protein
MPTVLPKYEYNPALLGVSRSTPSSLSKGQRPICVVTPTSVHVSYLILLRLRQIRKLRLSFLVRNFRICLSSTYFLRGIIKLIFARHSSTSFFNFPPADNSQPPRWTVSEILDLLGHSDWRKHKNLLCSHIVQYTNITTHKIGLKRPPQ